MWLLCAMGVISPLARTQTQENWAGLINAMEKN